MDLEELTKHQLVLLALLVSFVTSIATGIMTVSLMNQSSPAVSNTINQIVERTVQTVASAGQTVASVASPAPAPVPVTDQTVSSIAAAQKAIIKITPKGSDDFVARGVIVDNKGTALTDAQSLYATGAGAFDATLSDGTHVTATIRPGQSATTTVLVLDLSVGTSTGFAPVSLIDSSKLKLGQGVVRIGGKGADTVAEGIIAALPANGSSDIETSVVSTTPGALLMTLSGNVIGITTIDSLSQSSDIYTLVTSPSATK